MPQYRWSVLKKAHLYSFSLSSLQKCVCGICSFLHKFFTTSMVAFSMDTGVEPARNVSSNDTSLMFR